MALDKTQPIVQLGLKAQSELMDEAPKLALSLFGKEQPDAQSVGKQAYTAYVQRNWQDQAFRVAEAQRNPAAFLQAFRALGGVLPGEPGHPQTAEMPDGNPALHATQTGPHGVKARGIVPLPADPKDQPLGVPASAWAQAVNGPD